MRLAGARSTHPAAKSHMPEMCGHECRADESDAGGCGLGPEQHKRTQRQNGQSRRYGQNDATRREQRRAARTETEGKMGPAGKAAFRAQGNDGQGEQNRGRH